MDDNSKSIGQKLILESQGPQPKKRGLSDELFPYIRVASLNGMSSRAISRWLEKQEKTLSAAMIAKVIRESDKRCLRLYEQMIHKENQMCSPLAGRDTLLPLTSNLFDKHEFESRSPHHFDQALLLLADECGTKKQMFEAYDFIMNEWFSLPEEFRRECQRVVNEQRKEVQDENANR